MSSCEMQRYKDEAAPVNNLTPFWSKEGHFLKVHNQIKGIIHTNWHPGSDISWLWTLLLNFQMKRCHLLPLPVRVYVSHSFFFLSFFLFFFFNHHIALSLCKHNTYPHAQHPETPVAYKVAMATARCTQACFHAAGTHAALRASGGMLGKWSGGSGVGSLRLIVVASTVKTCKPYQVATVIFVCYGAEVQFSR